MSVGYAYPAVLHLGDRIIGDSSEHALLSIRDLWWVKPALQTPGLRVFHTDHIFHPEGVSLYFHTPVPLYGLFSIPFQLIWNLAVAHNLIVLVSFIIGGFTAFLLARYVLRDESAAFVAGAAFYFSAYHIGRAMGHINLVLIQWLPLYALLLLKTADSEWFAVAAGTCLLLILLVDLHYLFHCALLTAVYAFYILRLAKAERAQMVQHIKLLAIVGLIFVLLGLPVFMPMVSEAASSPGTYPDATEVPYHSADLLSYFTPIQYQLLYDGRFGHIRSTLLQEPYEGHNLVGYVCLALGVIGLRAAWRQERRKGLFWMGVVLFLWTLSLGPRLHVQGQTEFTKLEALVLLPHAFLHKLPIAGISRAVGRVSVMVLLGFAGLGGS